MARRVSLVALIALLLRTLWTTSHYGNTVRKREREREYHDSQCMCVLHALGTCTPSLSPLPSLARSPRNTRTRRSVFSSLVASWSITTAVAESAAGTLLSALRLNTSYIFSLSLSVACVFSFAVLVFALFPTRHCLLLTSTSVSVFTDFDSHSACQQCTVRQAQAVVNRRRIGC